MAPKKRKVSRIPPRRPVSRRGAGGRRARRGRRVALGFLAVLMVAVGLAFLYLANRSPAEIPVPSSVTQVVGGPLKNGTASLDSPRGIAFAPDGDLYVADLGHSRVAVFGPDGSFKFAFGSAGPAGGADKPGQFNEPSGVAVGPHGSVYVADAWNGRIQKFSPRGRPLAEFGGPRYSFYSPRTVAVDGRGNIYVGDTGNSEVKVIDPSGKLLKTLGGVGGGSGGYSREVFGIALDARGDIFVADHGNHRIHEFGPLPGCAWVRDRKVPGWEEADPFWPELAVDRQGLVYAGDSGNGKVWIYGPDLKYRGTLDGRAWAAPLEAPVGLAFDRAGALWISDMADNRLLKLGPFAIPASR